MNYIQYDYCILYKEHDPFKWHCMWGANRSNRLVLYNPFEDRFEGKHFVLCYRLWFWWCVPWEYQQCCCTRDIYRLKYNSTMVFLCGTKTSTDYLDWNKLYLFFLYGDNYGVLSRLQHTGGFQDGWPHDCLMTLPHVLPLAVLVQAEVSTYRAMQSFTLSPIKCVLIQI